MANNNASSLKRSITSIRSANYEDFKAKRKPPFRKLVKHKAYFISFALNTLLYSALVVCFNNMDDSSSNLRVLYILQLAALFIYLVDAVINTINIGLTKDEEFIINALDFSLIIAAFVIAILELAS